MNKNQGRVLRFMKRIPSQNNTVATEPSIVTSRVAILRAKLMLEECMEAIVDGLGIQLRLRVDLGPATFFSVPIEYVQVEFRPYRSPDLVLIADGLADCEVVNLGTAVVCGIDVQPVFDEVMDNNDKKIDTGTIDEHGKLVKAPDHPKPDIEGAMRKGNLEIVL